MKKLLLIFMFFCLALPSYAAHIVGGEMIYSYVRPGATPNTSVYEITLKLFRDQLTTGAAMPDDVFIGIFDNGSLLQYPAANKPYDVIKSFEGPVQVNPFPPCINNAPVLNYHVGQFTLMVTLPDNTKGYTATYQTCCRVSPLENVFNTTGNGGTGSTYSCSIPPVIYDNSPIFSTSIDAICRLKKFSLQFSAIDDDNDSLVYAFVPAYNGGATQNSANVNPAPPNYASVNYINGFNFENQLGSGATIDPQTGIITGTAPDIGKYVVCVGVKSYRNGVLIGEHRKDFIVNVTDCDFAGALLIPPPVSCDGFSVNFTNGNTSPQNETFYWEFGDPASGDSNISNLASPTHVYSDTGTYVFKLVVNRGQQCSDSATQIQKVYPGFLPGFKVTGRCINSDILFTDTTKSRYGVVDAWRWDFGNSAASDDTSHLRNPKYLYSATGDYRVQFTVSNSKGCSKTVSDTISIIDKPDFKITNDTLICSIDTLQLTATGIGSILWTPNYNINNQVSFNPRVSPKTTTTYSATLTETPGCFATKSVVVNVVDGVTLDAGNDSTICQTDSVRLNTISDGLHFIWSPAASLNNDTEKNPNAAPLSNTTYHVVASIGKCNADDDVTIRVVPYPKAYAGTDTTICFPKSYQLHASGGSSYLWVPGNFLNNANIPDPIATPPQSVRYIVAVKDILGCPKAAFDTVLLQVEKIIADAGPRDTSIVVNQPLQLSGTGAESFSWNPPTGLNNSDIANPVALLSENQQYILRVESPAGCTGTDTIDVIVYKVNPGLYVPNAFTPNGDGNNDIFRPIPIGMKAIKYFKVYNRRGQLMFSTTTQNKGWDGTFKGSPQDSQVFVWIVEGVDYQDKVIFQKGTVTLIR
jgi:gliding motility-associated-like protein